MQGSFKGEPRRNKNESTRETEQVSSPKVASDNLKSNKIQVAAYCRGNSLSNEEEESLNNQMEHYTDTIESNPEWQFAGIYSDRDKSGTRTGFQKLISQALSGGIDLILCQSISRFGGNMIDTLNTVRRLGEHQIRIIFEKEGIDTGHKQSEIILSQLYAAVQVESRNLSDSSRWTHTKRFQRGEPIFIRMLGYRLDGKQWLVIPEEAAVVKEAFKRYLEGQTPVQIARRFIQKGYSKANGRTDWSAIAVSGILKNERYTGDALCRKSQRHDPLDSTSDEKERVKDQYLIKNHHEAIITHDTYERVQTMLVQGTKRERVGSRKTYPLSGRLRCQRCGGNIQRFICREVVTWRCGNHMKSKKLCSMTGIREVIIMKAMTQAFDEHYQLLGSDLVEQQLIKLANDLQSISIVGDVELKQLRMDFNRLLLRENEIILQGDEGVDGSTELETLGKQREEIEIQISHKEAWLQLLEEDNGYRKETIKVLERLQNTSEPMIELKEQRREMTFLRAFAVVIEALSPFTFTITWLSGKTTTIELEEGE